MREKLELVNRDYDGEAEIKKNVAEWSTYILNMEKYVLDYGTKNMRTIQKLFNYGKIFVVAKTPNGLAFVPSTFAGMKGVTYKNYHNRFGGGQTKQAINECLGECKPDKELTAELHRLGRNIEKPKFWVIGKIKLNPSKKSGKKNDPKPSDEEAKEGKRRLQEIELISRSATLAKACKERDKYTCQACGFKCNYGNGAVICHHKIMVSTLGTEKITNIKKLITLCPTCHSIAHINGNKKNPLTIKAIQKVLRKHCQRPSYT